MTSFEMMRAALMALLGVCFLSAITYFVLGERLLREVRARFPDEWRSAGNPTFLSLAVAGAGFWRPVSAGNFFTFQRYATLADESLVKRGRAVRMWQFVMYGSFASFFLFGTLLSRPHRG